MLKIKDNVDLKKLVKRFDNDYSNSNYETMEYFEEGNCIRFNLYQSCNNYITCHIDLDTRELTVDAEIDNDYDFRLNIDLLYDLIKLNLVEKVAE